MDVFKTYKDALASYGVDCSFRPADDDFPMPLLIVDLGPDSQGRERKMSIRYSDVPLKPDAEELSFDPDFDDIAALQRNQQESREVFTHFYVALPFPYEDQAIGELARLLLFLNKGLDFAGWGLDEADRHVYFHYVLHSPKQVETPRLIAGIVGMITLVLDSMADYVELVACGEKSLAELAQEMLSLTEEGADPGSE